MEINRIQEAEIFEKLSAAQVRVFQVSIADVSKLTKLDFGKLGQADAHEATSVGPRLIESYDDIRISITSLGSQKVQILWRAPFSNTRENWV